MAQHRGANSLSTHFFGDIHRFNFSVAGREPLQSAHAQEGGSVPNRPKANIGRLQASEVQSMIATGRSFGSGAGQMCMQKFEHAGIGEVAVCDSDHCGFLCASYAASADLGYPIRLMDPDDAVAAQLFDRARVKAVDNPKSGNVIGKE